MYRVIQIKKIIIIFPYICLSSECLLLFFNAILVLLHLQLNGRNFSDDAAPTTMNSRRCVALAFWWPRKTRTMTTTTPARPPTNKSPVPRCPRLSKRISAKSTIIPWTLIWTRDLHRPPLRRRTTKRLPRPSTYNSSVCVHQNRHSSHKSWHINIQIIHTLQLTHMNHRKSIQQ